MFCCSLVKSLALPHTLSRMTINAAILARIYRSVLDEAFAIAKASVELDMVAAAAIRDAFSAAIPTIVPWHLAHQVGAPIFMASLKSDATQLLLRVCASPAMPRGAFVLAVAEATTPRNSGPVR
jgi:hypothetical protein